MSEQLLPLVIVRPPSKSTISEILALSEPNTGEAILAVHPSGDIIAWNAHAATLFGYSLKDLCVLRVPELIRNHELCWEGMTQVSEYSNSSKYRVLEAIRKNGDSFSLESRLTAISDSIVVIHCARVSNALSPGVGKRELLEGFFNNATVHMSVVEVMDDDFVYVLANNKVAAFFGLPQSDIVGRGARELGVPGDLVDDLLKRFHDCLVVGETALQEYSVTFKGQTRWFLGNMNPCPLIADERPRIRIVATDITRHKDAELALERAERKFRGIFEQATEGIYQSSLDGRLLTANPAAARILGYDSPDSLLREVPNIIALYRDPKDRAKLIRLLQESGNVEGFEVALINKMGGITWASISARFKKCEEGSSVLIEGLLQDITSRKVAADQLNLSESLFRLISENVSDLITLIDENETCLYASSSYHQLGYDPDALAGKAFIDLVHPEDKLRVQDELKALLESYVARSFEFRIRRQDDTWRRMEAAISLLINDTGARIVAVSRDITERINREEALAREKHLLDTLVDNLPDRIYVKDAESRFILNNRAHVHALKAKNAEELLGHTDADFRPAELASAILAHDRVVLVKGEALYGYEEPTILENGEPGWLLSTKVPLRDNDQKIVGLVGISRDITESKRIKSNLELKNTILATQLETSLDAILLVDQHAAIQSFNQRFIEMWNIPRELVLSGDDTVVLQQVTDEMEQPALFLERVQALYANREEKSRDTLHTKDKRIIDRYSAPVIADTGEYYGRVWYFRDITERIRREEEREYLRNQMEEQNIELESAIASMKQMQSSLVQSEKMASIGQLTAGIAHEINNPLAFVSSNLNRFSEYFSDTMKVIEKWHSMAGEPLNQESLVARSESIRGFEESLDLTFVSEDFQRLMGHTQEGIERIKSIVDRLRGFSHISDMGFSDANLNDALDNSLTIVWNEIKYRAAVTKNYSTLPLVTCSLGEIEQVFVNLFVNAAHAMSEKGQITLTTAAEGDFVTVTIADTGCGISPKNLSRIFDPFFTTKPVGKGTGLGLWISATIIEKHRGSISVESTPGVGTVFLVRLPVHQTGDSGGGENGNVA